MTAQTFHSAVVATESRGIAFADRMKAAAAALTVGFLLVFTTGFAHPEALHNAAHDSRHAMSFPCH